MKALDTTGSLKVAIASPVATPASAGDSFVTISHDADLTGERVLTAGSGITITDNGANSTVDVAINQAVMLKMVSLRG